MAVSGERAFFLSFLTGRDSSSCSSGFFLRSIDFHEGPRLPPSILPLSRQHQFQTRRKKRIHSPLPSLIHRPSASLISSLIDQRPRSYWPPSSTETRWLRAAQSPHNRIQDGFADERDDEYSHWSNTPWRYHPCVPSIRVVCVWSSVLSNPRTNLSVKLGWPVQS